MTLSYLTISFVLYSSLRVSPSPLSASYGHQFLETTLKMVMNKVRNSRGKQNDFLYYFFYYKSLHVLIVPWRPSLLRLS